MFTDRLDCLQRRISEIFLAELINIEFAMIVVRRHKENIGIDLDKLLLRHDLPIANAERRPE